MAKVTQGIERFVDFIGEIAAFLTIVLIIVMAFNGKYAFLPPDTEHTFSYVREIAILAVVSLKALEFALKRRVLLFFITLAIIGLAVALMFFPTSIPFWSHEPAATEIVSALLRPIA
jgi:hypothetical protein